MARASGRAAPVGAPFVFDEGNRAFGEGKGRYSVYGTRKRKVLFAALVASFFVSGGSVTTGAWRAWRAGAAFGGTDADAGVLLVHDDGVAGGRVTYRFEVASEGGVVQHYTMTETVDHDTLANLHEGSKVKVTYPPTQPSRARLKGGPAARVVRSFVWGVGAAALLDLAALFFAGIAVFNARHDRRVNRLGRVVRGHVVGAAPGRAGVEVRYRFTPPGGDPLETTQWRRFEPNARAAPSPGDAIYVAYVAPGEFVAL